jgi:hypothetical protein
MILEAGFFLGAIALLNWLVAAYEFWSYRKWGRVPRELLVSRDGVTLMYLGSWRMRSRHLRSDQIAVVGLHPLRWNLNWQRKIDVLVIKPHWGFSRTFRLPSPDPHMPTRIAKRIRSLLGDATSGF